GGAGCDGRGGRPGLRRAGGVRQLRVSRVALGVVRASRVLVGLVEAALPGGVHRGAVELATDGLLVAPVTGGRRAASRGAGAPAPREPLGGGGLSGRGAFRSGAPVGPRLGARGGRGDGGTDRGGAAGAALGGERGPGVPGRRH